MSKATTLLMLVLLLGYTLSCAARPIPPALLPKATMVKTQHEVHGVDEVVKERCEGGVEEEECLMRRTLAAHLDYIYTQKQKP